MRCTMCDNALKSSEIIWYETEQRHEDLCSKCRGKVAEDMRNAGWDDVHIPVDDVIQESEEI